MADEIQIDKNVFHNRLSSFLSHWKADKRGGDSSFGGVGSVVICVGKASDGAYTKGAAFQLWLLGYEFPATLFVLTQDALHIVTTKKKASYLEPLKEEGKTPIEIHIRGKDAEENAKQFEACLNVVKKAGKKVGLFTKETANGPFAEAWKGAFEKATSDLEQVDMSAAISTAALSIKDEKELRNVRDASRASTHMIKFLSDEIVEIIDEEKKITHKNLADKIRDKLDDNAFFKKIKVSNNFDPIHLDWALTPVVQSGGQYDLKFASESDESNLRSGVILASLGLRYQTYACSVSRTYMIDPNKSQESAYKLLLQVHDTVVKSIRDGVVAKDVYNKAIGVIKAKKPELEKNFVKSIGSAIGIELRDTTLVLNGKNNRTLRDGMTLAITVGFADLTNPDPKTKRDGTYSLVITDTVRVAATEAAVFSKDAALDLDSVAFYFNDEEEPTPKKKTQKDSRVGAVAKSNITSTRLRNERQTNQNEEKEAQRREHQKELHEKKQREGLQLYAEVTGSLNGTVEKKFKRFESYKRDNQFPTRVRDLQIVVDHKASTIVLPIMGRPVPFHINTVKNASTAQEGDASTLRINLVSPGQGVGRKDDQPFEDPSAHFVRSFTFRSTDRDRMEQLASEITDLKKASNRRAQEKKQMEDVVEQDKLVTAKDRRPPKLDHLFIRPTLDGKRVAGHVEIHQNGIRYVHGLNQTHVDILFSNIRHLFFQPCAHELIVIIHLHLVNPIMIGKKKAKDLQFYREATEMQFDETGNRRRKHRYGDEEEFEQEQEERRRRAELDKEFKAFTKKIEDAASKMVDMSADVPIRDLGFNGVHSRSSVLMQPTTDCLVQLTEPPFFVVTLSDIELVHLERVQFGLKNFDMVVVFHDYNRPVAHINTIPVESLDIVKDWLDSCEIPFTEGPLNLNWSTIMKTVVSNPHQFFVDGGWSFLAAESDDEDGDDEDEESDFEMDADEFNEAESSEEDSEEVDEYASDDEGSAEDDEDDDGEDWDEMERKAKQKDREAGSEDEDKSRKRKR
ncbi:SPT16-domain-containing protein [Eremomyces bilateralis CBS 781.70]|uniref:FACT complex subunit n=1 Tax=Eremomyces bilateralis CBS 781.70 TaxID=1392243 RepID=A0A6G1G9F7_9PEZI|nr:SPT16-domain-containing protein [Eremomyces bilateralis CBS 781.70]KAF1814664.1 SPT16-domain-containing protein [Eremomyces bilateralis CBS 781.70]